MEFDFCHDFSSISKSLLSGQTFEIEDKMFQDQALPVFIYYTPLPSQGLELDSNETNRTLLFVTSIDGNQSIAKQSFDNGNFFRSIFFE